MVKFNKTLTHRFGCLPCVYIVVDETAETFISNGVFQYLHHAHMNNI